MNTHPTIRSPKHQLATSQNSYLIYYEPVPLREKVFRTILSTNMNGNSKHDQYLQQHEPKY